MTAVKRDKPLKTPQPAAPTLRAKPRPIDLDAACDAVMKRYPKVLARLAE